MRVWARNSEGRQILNIKKTTRRLHLMTERKDEISRSVREEWATVEIERKALCLCMFCTCVLGDPCAADRLTVGSDMINVPTSPLLSKPCLLVGRGVHWKIGEG